MDKEIEVYKPTKKQVVFPTIILIVTLLIGGICLLVARGLGGTNEKESFLAPGTASYNCVAPGNYTIYLATKTTFEGKAYSVPKDFKELELNVTMNGNEVPVSEVEEGYEYGEGDEVGKTYVSFEAAEAGEYVITSTVDSKETPQVVIAVGKTETHLDTIMILATVACLSIGMGGCQFVAYMIFNLVRFGIYTYKRKQFQ